MNADAPPLVLASGSAYRAGLLKRLGLPFSQESPGIDESSTGGEEPAALAVRLARAKASAVASRHPGAVVIGSDQVAVRDGRALGKPGSRAAAREQLVASAGKEMEFLTAVCVLPADPGREPEEHMDITRVVFRPLDHGMIDRYLDRDHPLDCAGSFRSESLGVALVERIDSHDPTALVGLPLIWLSGALARLGLPPL